jgi:hypothetical protein
MYNPYLPQGEYEPLTPPKPQNPEPSSGGLLERLFSAGSHLGLPGGEKLGKLLRLDRLDKGDLLLVLVLLYLSIESDDEDWLIVLALVVLMGFS